MEYAELPFIKQKNLSRKIRVILFGIPILFSTRNSYVKGVPPIDSAPGGMAEIPNEWVEDNNLQDLIRVPYNSFCFVPTTSSLDIYDPNGPNFYQDLSDYDNVIQNLTSFDRYIASTDTSVTTYGDAQENQEHIDWNDRNGAFTLAELAVQNDLASSTLQDVSIILDTLTNCLTPITQSKLYELRIVLLRI